MRTTVLTALLLGAAIASAAQVPVPFPRPGTPPASKTTTPDPQAPPVVAAPGPPAQLPAGEPTEAALGAPIYPGAQFITSYDAGRGQRYYLFGTQVDFAQIVGYYRNILDERGDLVFEEPPIHMFETGRFREQTMAFPPSVTVKDYTWGGSLGYLNPKPGAEPARYRTIIQIVPAPAGTSGR